MNCTPCGCQNPGNTSTRKKVVEVHIFDWILDGVAGKIVSHLNGINSEISPMFEWSSFLFDLVQYLSCLVTERYGFNVCFLHDNGESLAA